MPDTFAIVSSCCGQLRTTQTVRPCCSFAYTLSQNQEEQYPSIGYAALQPISCSQKLYCLGRFVASLTSK